MLGVGRCSLGNIIRKRKCAIGDTDEGRTNEQQGECESLEPQSLLGFYSVFIQR